MFIIQKPLVEIATVEVVLFVLGLFLSRIFNYLVKQNEALQVEKAKNDRLLYSILPKKIAEELKETGSVAPQKHKNVSILFTDFVGFTKVAEKSTAEGLLLSLDGCFYTFDSIATKYNLERLKTIGDSYMCVAGLPDLRPTHALDICLAALEIREFINQMRSDNDEQKPFWNIRIGISSGEVIAGVVGNTKFSYDVWGNSVNLASRMESSAREGGINVSRTTYDQVKKYFHFDELGVQVVKHNSQFEMFQLKSLREEYASDSMGLVANDFLRGTFLAELAENSSYPT
jgi:class 3 adenylate cyclase